MLKQLPREVSLALTRWQHIPSRCISGLQEFARAAEVASPHLFMRELLVSPAAVGAVWPSSRKLAVRMAEPVPLQGEGYVVELGAGTGAVTQALLRKGVDPRRLRVIEQSPAFVARLRQRFPQVTVLCGDAVRLADLLPGDCAVDAIVSSLPLRSLPDADVAAIVRQWHHMLAPGKCLVQFTYALHGQPDAGLSSGFVKTGVRLVWGNLPPAKVMTFVRVPEAPDQVARSC